MVVNAQALVTKGNAIEKQPEINLNKAYFSYGIIKTYSYSQKNECKKSNAKKIRATT